MEVKAAKPDLIVFVGDYIFNPNSEQLSVHRENIINAMKLVDPAPRAVVLGNYESLVKCGLAGWLEFDSTWRGCDGERGHGIGDCKRAPSVSVGSGTSLPVGFGLC